MSTSRLTVLGLVAMLAAPAHAQEAATGAEPLGPIRCYVHATALSNLETLKAKQLCTGATSDAPARCFAEATDRVGMTDLDAVRLCQAATSTAPAICADRVDDTMSFVSAAIADYCAALRWPLVPAPTGGSPECLEAALDRTLLSTSEAARLCAGSASTGPIACYQQGRDETSLTDADLVDLCTTVVIAPYYRPWAP